MFSHSSNIGANNGIGYETVVALAKNSADYHIFLGSRSIEKGNSALEKINKEYGSSLKSTISVVNVDVTDPKTIEAAKEEVASKFGRLDILINNAGLLLIDPKIPTSKKIRDMMEVNVIGPNNMIETFEPLLKKSSAPLIINVSSEQGSITLRLDKTYKFSAVRGDEYRASKAALNMMTACYRWNFEEWGCRVISFNPGFCVTDLTGEEGRKMRIEAGARSAQDPAYALLDIVTGKRDADIAKSGIVDLDGGVHPW